MPGAVTNKRNLYLGKCLDDLHRLSELKPIQSPVNIIVRSANKVFQDAEKLDKEGDEEKAFVMYMKYFNIVKQVKTKVDYKKQKAYYDSLIGQKNQLQAIERAESLTESLKERYDFKEAELLAKKLPSVGKVTEKKEPPEVVEVSTDTNGTSTKPETKETETRSNAINCMQLCDLLRDSNTKLILMDVRTTVDFAQSHISHSECINIPEDLIIPGSTVTHIESKLTDESKVVWKTRKNADYIILIDWRSKLEDVKVGTPLQTLKDALYKFDTSVIIQSEPVLLEGGYENWLMLYPTLTTNPHVAVPHQTSGQDRDPSPTLMLDFDYPELDENLQKKSNVPLPQNNNEPPKENGNISVNSVLPKVDRSLKPSQSNKSNVEPTDSNQGINISQLPQVSDRNMYPNLILDPKGVFGQNTPIPNNTNNGPKPINLSVKNNLSTDNPRQIQGKEDNVNSLVITKNGKLQGEMDKMDEVEKKIRDLELLQKKKERDVADLMRKERKIKEELIEKEKNREENERHYAEEEKMRKSRIEQAEREEEEKRNRNLNVERMRAERKKEEEEQSKTQKEEEESLRIEAEKEALRMKEEKERKERELEILEKQRQMEEEEQEKLNQEMIELEKAKAERQKKEELLKMEEKKRLEADREAKEREKLLIENARKEEERKMKEEREKKAIEEARKAKENAEKALELRNKEKNATDQRNERSVPTTNLPTGWEKRLDKDTNRYYYIDHNNGATTWSLPTGIAKVPDTYTTKLRDEPPTLSRGLSRSHSSPNIMKELAEEEKAMARKPVTNVDRANKPVSHMNSINRQPMYSMRKRDLNPVYGNVTSGLTGLRNLGNTCYMNSTIQCLSNTSPLISYFLSNNYHQDINRDSSQGMHGEVVDDFSIVIKALWSGQHRSITPRDLKSTVGKYNPMFAGYQQQDSQEFLTFLLDGLHEGLNEVKKAPDIPEQNNDKLSDDKAARIAWEHHKLLHQSIIVELFQGQLKSSLMCKTCGKKSVTFQAFMFLSLPIPASSRCSLNDCIQEFLKPEMMTGSSKWKCPNCKVERDSAKKIDIWKLPPILLVGLNRFYSDGMWMQKKTTYVDFPVMDVDLSTYILGPPPKSRYNLYGISNHYGTMEGGHYTSFCRNPLTKKWYKFDDQDVSEISKSDIKTSAAFVLYYTSLEMAAPQYKIGI